ncbi:50S ribosomal protein L19e [Candidatus Woesearchaeota archaeon]|nr:50S ribosomal protein L19e [Candidatus Woesearchaeota archaeon]
MNLNVQKRLAADILKGSKNRVRFDTGRIEEIKESITKADIRGLIQDNAIWLKPKKGVSRSRAKKRSRQVKKGLRRGMGSRKGTANARYDKKRKWINKIRAQRKLLKELKNKKKISDKDYRKLYTKSKGGFFRSRRHIRLYINEKGLLKNVKQN